MWCMRQGQWLLVWKCGSPACARWLSVKSDDDGILPRTIDTSFCLARHMKPRRVKPKITQ